MKIKLIFTHKFIIGIISFFAVSAAFTGCGTNYDDELDQIRAEIAKLQTDVTAIQTKIGSGALVTNITTSGNNLVVNFSDGTANTITSIKGDKGDPGTNGTNGIHGRDGILFVIKDSLWHTVGANNDTTLYTGNGQYPDGLRAVPREGGSSSNIEVKPPRLDTDGSKWWFYTWNTGSMRFDSVSIDIGASSSIVSYIVDPGTSYDYYTLYVRAQDSNGNIGTALSPFRLPKYGRGGGSSSTLELLGFFQLTDYNTADISRSALENTDLTGKRRTISKVVYHDKTTGLDEDTTWTKGTKEIPENKILTSAVGWSVIIRCDIDPSGNSFSLQTSSGNEANLIFGEVQPLEGRFTKAMSTGGLYAIPIVGTNSNLIQTGDLYRLVTNFGNSNYSKTTIEFANSTDPLSEIMVGKVGPGDVIGGSASITNDKEYYISFNYPSGAESTVYDYYMESTNSNFHFDNSNGSFIYYGTTPVKVDVYKLHLDGKIYKETLTLNIV